MKQYDAHFIFVQSGRDEAWAKTIERMQGEITRIGGKVLSTEDLGKKTFARPQQKKESGTYLTIRFELDPALRPHRRDLPPPDPGHRSHR